MASLPLITNEPTNSDEEDVFMDADEGDDNKDTKATAKAKGGKGKKGPAKRSGIKKPPASSTASKSASARKGPAAGKKAPRHGKAPMASSPKQKLDDLKGMKKKRRFRAGTQALREIKKYQQTTDLLIPRSSFNRMVREIIQTMDKGDLRMQRSAMIAIQEAAEAFLVDYFSSCVHASAHARRVTVMPRDSNLVKTLGTKVQ